MDQTRQDNPSRLAERHLSERGLALRWGISPRTLQRMRSRGEAPPFLRLGTSIRYAMEDVIAFEARVRHHGGRSQ